jgi:hypothetical protein
MDRTDGSDASHFRMKNMISRAYIYILLVYAVVICVAELISWSIFLPAQVDREAQTFVGNVRILDPSTSVHGFATIH